jgi:hypothetical protein
VSEVVPDTALQALHRFGIDGLDDYGRALRAACAAFPPPFGFAWYGERYRYYASDPSWFANSLIANAAKEGEGSSSLWGLCSRIKDPQVADLVRRHAVDESRHARFYISLLKLTFPELQEEIQKQQFMRLSPGYTIRDHPPPARSSAEEQVLDELIQMNIGEVRTLIHQMLMAPVIVLHSPANCRRRMQALMNGLGRDERIHIGYTAKLIDAAAKINPRLVHDLMQRRVRDFNNLTLTEVGLRDVDPGAYE